MARQEHQAQYLRLSFLLACIFSIALPIPSLPLTLYDFHFPLNVPSLRTCSIDDLLQFYSPFERAINGREPAGPRPIHLALKVQMFCTLIGLLYIAVKARLN